MILFVVYKKVMTYRLLYCSLEFWESELWWLLVLVPLVWVWVVMVASVALGVVDVDCV